MKRIRGKENKLRRELSIMEPAYADFFILWLLGCVCFLHRLHQTVISQVLACKKAVIYNDQLKQHTFILQN